MSLNERYQDLIKSIEEKKQEELEKLDQLNHTYKQIMGIEDPSITEKKGTIEALFDSKIAKMESQFSRFQQMMEIDDSLLRIVNSNERIDFDEDVAYNKTKDATLLEKLKERRLTGDTTTSESFYWSNVFPISENDGVQAQPIELSLPAIIEHQVPLLRYELGKIEDKELIQRIERAIDFVNSQTERAYDLLALTRDELFELEAGLRDYLEGDSTTRIEQMIDFINSPFSSAAWNRLTLSEQETVKYSRKRDYASSEGNFKKMNKPREERLAKIILKTHKRMVEYNSQFREDGNILIGRALDNPSAHFFVERFLIQNVGQNREPVYTQVVRQNLLEFCRFHDSLSSALSPDEVKELDVDFQVKKMKDLLIYYNNHKKLSYKQRRFAFDLMTKYSLKVKIAPEEFKLKIVEYLKGQRLSGSSNAEGLFYGGHDGR